MTHALRPRRKDRSLVALVLLVCVSGTAVRGGPAAVELSYLPDKQSLTIVVPTSASGADRILDLPDWLVPVPGAVDGTAMFSGTLPDARDGLPGVGATKTEAFLLGALDWLPTDHGEPTEIRLTAPASHRGVATGALLSEGATGDGYFARFRLYGAPGEWGVFFGPYVVSEHVVATTRGDVPVRTYFRADQAQHAGAYLEAAGRHLGRYDATIGPYPYDSFAVISAPIPVGFGLPGATYIAEQILGHPYMLGRSLAHEVLHAWWGGAVGVNYATGNWAEGLTTYQADHELAAERDPEAAKAMRRDWLSSLTSLPVRSDRPVRSFVSASHDRDQSIGYGKTAMVFHMLNRHLGNEAFGAGLSLFYRTHRNKVAGWADLQTALEAASGEDLEPFFSQWLDRTGLPEVRPLSAEATPTGDGFLVALTLAQEGDVYDVSVPITVETEDGAVVETLRLDASAEIFEIEVDARPLSIAADPDFDVARRLLKGELPATLRDALRAGTPALMLGEGAAAAGKEMARTLFEGDLPGKPLAAPPPHSDIVVAVGGTDEIASFQERRLGGRAPDVARAGDSRAWAEQDGSGRIWLFVSANDLSTLGERLPALRYYGNQSFVIFADGAAPESGRWPVEASPMRLSLQ